MLFLQYVHVSSQQCVGTFATVSTAIDGCFVRIGSLGRSSPRPPGENPKTDSELRVINKKHISPVTKHISPVTTSFNVKLKKLYLL